MASIWDTTGWEEEDLEDVSSEEGLSEDDVIIQGEEDIPFEEEEDDNAQWFMDLMNTEEEEPVYKPTTDKMKEDVYLSSWIPSTPTPKTNITSNAKYAYNYLNQKGLPGHVSAGIVGNLMKESNVNPTTRDGDKRGGIGGIAQWDPARSRELVNFSKASGRNPQDLDTQLDFVLHEAEQRGDLDKTLKARTPEEAAVVFGRSYERPSEKYADWETRQSNARGLMAKQYGGKIARNGINNTPQLDDLEGIDDESIQEYLDDNRSIFENLDSDVEENEDGENDTKVQDTIAGAIKGVTNVVNQINAFKNRAIDVAGKTASNAIDAQTEMAGIQRNASSLRKYNLNKNRKKYSDINTTLNQPLIYT